MEQFPGQLNESESPEEFQVVNGRRYHRVIIDGDNDFWELVEEDE